MIKTLLSCVCTLLLLTGSAVAQDKFVVPKQVVVGAEEVVPANELVILKVSPIDSSVKYLVDTKYSWVVLADGKEKKNVLVFPDNTTIGFSRGNAKNMQAMLVINYLYVVRENDDPKGKIIEVAQRSSGIIFVEIKFYTPNPPGPPDPPGPGPDSDPTFPIGKFDLSKISYQLAKANVPAVNRQKGATAIANSTSGISASIRAGALTDPADILTKLKAANNSALKNVSVAESEWDDFGMALQKKLVEFYRANKLKTASDYADAFDEIAAGLSKVK